MRSPRSCFTIAAVVLTTALSACVLDDLFSPELPADLTVEITGDSLLTVGDTVSLDVRVLSEGEKVVGVRLSFTSSRPTVAEITTDGRVAILARDTFSITAEITSGSLAGDPPSVTAAFRGVAHRIVASLDTVLFSSLTATRQLTASGVGMRGDILPGVDIVWHSEISNVVSVEPTTGLLTAVSNGGPVPIIAQADTRADTVQVVVRQRTGTITISPDDAALRATGETIQFSAELRDSLDQSNDVSEVSWSTTAANVVTVDGDGLATAGTEGIANIVAMSDGAADTARVLVSRLMATLDVIPEFDTLTAVGESTQLSATGTDDDGNHVAAPFVRWHSLHEAVALVDTVGVVTATGNGDALIVGESGGVEDTVTVTVSQIVAAVSISSPASDTTFTSLGDSAAFVALARDSNGYPIPGRVFNWSAADTTIAVATTDGTVISRAVGSTRIDAEADGYIGSRTVTVGQQLASINVSPDTVMLAYGEIHQLRAEGYDARGFEIPGIGFNWDSRDWGIVSVDGDGWINPEGDGATHVIATSDGLSDSSLIRVGPLTSMCANGTPHQSDITADETWTLAGSPHCVGGWVSVIGGAKLTIEPGVEVLFISGAMLRLGRSDLGESGSVFAEGTPAAPITFTPFNNSGSPGQWYGMHVEWVGSDDSLALRNATLEYAGRDNYGTIANLNTFSGTIVLESVTIRESQGSAINLQNQGTATSFLNIDNSTIENNQWSGIVLADGAASITNTRITNNGGHGIRGNQSGGSLSLSGNRISGNNYPLRISSDLLGGITGQNIDSLLGNTNDTLIVECCGAVSATDTLRTSPNLPWRIDTNDLEFVDNTIWKIEAGATVVANAGTHFRFNGGALRAEGTQAAPVSFTSTGRNRGDWGQLAFNSPTDTSLLRNVEFRYGGGHGYESTLAIESGVAYPVILDTVLVTESNSTGILIRGTTIVTGPIVADSNDGTGLYLNTPGITLTDSRFVGNNGSGLYTDDAATGLTVLRSVLTDNGDWGANLHTPSITLDSNTISNNTNGGLYNDRGSSTARGNTIQNNSGNGLDFGGSSLVVVENNLVADNTGTGLRLGPAQSVFGNRVRGNESPARIHARALGPFASQDVDSLLGNVRDTLFIENGWDETTTATDTLRTTAALPWWVNVGTITLDGGTVWKLEPGATIVLNDAGFTLEDGVVLAEGEDAAPIVFTGNSPNRGQWRGIHINNTSDTSRFTNVVLRYGGGLAMSNGEAVLDNVRVVESNGDGINISGARYFAVNGPVVADSNDGRGMYVNTPDVTLTDSRFVGNGGNGLYTDDAATGLTVLRSVLTDNGDWGANLHTPSITLDSNTISNNTNGGLYNDRGSATARGNTIQNNGGDGLNFGGASLVVVENNLVTDNTGTGLRLGPAQSVFGNRVRGNQDPARIHIRALGPLASQDVDSLLGNVQDTLFIESGWDETISATDTLRTTAALPWWVNVGTIYLDGGTVWKVDSGATVIFDNSGFDIQDGVVLAEGTISAPILFTGSSPNRGHWRGIHLTNTSDTSRFTHVELRYGGGLGMSNGEAVLDDVRVVESNGDGINISGARYFAVNGPVVADSNDGNGISLNVPGVTIADSRFVGNGNSGLRTDDGAVDLTLLRSEITDNGNWGAELYSTRVVVDSSVISRNTNGGLLSDRGSSSIARGNTIDGNGGTGLYLWGPSSTRAEGNLITNNAGAGAQLSSAQSITRNLISGNLYPLKVEPISLAALEAQNVDSLLGNAGDTLFIEGGGNVPATDTIRTRTSLPWHANTSINIVGGTVWRIEPGATIVMSGGGSNLWIDGGALLADGQGAEITIRGANASPGDWGYLYFQATSDTSLLRNVEIRHGGGQGDANLVIEGGVSRRVRLDSVRVVGSNAGGIRANGNIVVDNYMRADSNAGTGLSLGWGGVTVPKGSFSDNGNWGIDVSGGPFSLANATVDNNGFGGSQGGIRISGPGTTNISDSHVGGNLFQGVWLQCCGGSHTFTRVTIEDNGWHGVQLDDGSTAFTDNSVLNNGGDGINGSWDGQIFTVFSGNTVTGNGGYPLVMDPLSLQPFASQIQSDLVGNTRDTLRIYSGWGSSDQANIRGDVTVESFLPWQTNRNLTVGDGATLTLNAGATIVMDGGGAGLWIGETGDDQQPGRILALGTVASPVLLTALDAADPWHMLAIVNQLDSSVLRHTIIENGAAWGWSGVLDIGDAAGHSVVLDTVTVRRASNNNGVAISSPAYINGLSALDNDGSGLFLQGGTHTINGSRFERNGDDGIRVNGGSGHTVLQSILVDNFNAGLLNNTGDLVTAISNWWGDATGPSGSGAGTGDAVSSNVTFNPWLLTAPTVP